MQPAPRLRGLGRRGSDPTKGGRYTEARPSVGVIIPNHVRIASLLEALESVRAQSYRGLIRIYLAFRPRLNIEHLLGDLGHDVVLLPVDSEQGRNSISVKRNSALRETAEDYIAFLDDDDLWHPEKIGLQVAVLERTPNMVGACSRVRVFRTPPSWPLAPAKMAHRVLSAHQILRGQIAMSSLVVRREAAMSVAFDERPEWLAVEDYDFKLRVSRWGELARLEEGLTGLRVGQPSVSQPDRRLQAARSLDVLATVGLSSSPLRGRLVGLELAAVLAVAGTEPPTAEAVDRTKRALDGHLYGRFDNVVLQMVLAVWRRPKFARAVRTGGHIVRRQIARWESVVRR